MSRILVLGGSGFVGRHLVARLSAAGHAVLVPTRYRERAKTLLTLPTVEVVQADIHQPDTLRRLLAGCDAVFNLVGVLHSTRARAGERYGAQFARAHVELPRQLLQACREAGVHKLLHMSALGASTNGPSEYLRSKGAAEALLTAAADDPASSLQLRLFRPSVIYGEDDKFLNLFKDLQIFLPMLAVGGAEARFQPVWVEDVAAAMVAALQAMQAAAHAGAQRFDLVGPEVFTLRQLIRFAGAAAGYARPIIALPAPLAYLQAWAMEFLPGAPLSRDNLDSMREDNVSAAVFPFGIQPVAMASVASRWLAGQSAHGRLDGLRMRAGR
jgi:NADH dehydrogenase